MEFSQVLTLIATPKSLVEAVRAECPPIFNLEQFKEFLPSEHKVNKKTILARPDRVVFEPSGELDADGNPKKNADGSAHSTKKTIPVIRIAIPFEKKSVGIKSAFSCGKMELKAQYKEGSVEEKLFLAVKKVWEQNKVRYKMKTILRHRMAEMEVAVLWFRDTKDKKRLRMNVIAPTLGFTLRPVWDSILDLVAFGIEYKVVEAGKEYECLDFYTHNFLYRFTNKTGVWLLAENAISLDYGDKIPVIYDSQYQPECADAKPMREQYESIISDLGEQNKRTGSPILFAQGKVTGVPAGEPGKFFASDDKEGDLKLITNDNAPASIELEMKTLKSEMHYAVGTPDLSFEALKELGGNVSGETLRRLLIGLYIEAENEQDGNFGEFVQRNINFIKSACIHDEKALAAASELSIYPEFQPFSMDGIADRADTATKLIGGASTKAIFEYVALTDDPANDYEQYMEELKELATIEASKTPKVVTTAAPKPAAK